MMGYGCEIMAAVHTIKNQYRGINAHLHSHLQSEGSWDSFHSSHIIYLTSALKAKLLPIGYTAEVEHSLQIRRYDELAGKPESDVMLLDTESERFFQRQIPRPSMISAQEVLAIPDVIDVEEELAPYRAISIYEYAANPRDRGQPVGWIELLSPSNKPGGQDAGAYRTKRYKILQRGIVFVELDYLDESPSTFGRRISSKQAYRIVAIDPRPEFMEGLVYPNGFDVDEPIPTIDIPLNADDILTFDFNAPYQRTFEELFYGIELVDYRQLPLNFDRYSRDNRTRIAMRMLAVLKAARDGIDLDKNAPLPVEDIPLEDALTQLKSLT
jgi:uncharacterized protein DUF4058